MQHNIVTPIMDTHVVTSLKDYKLQILFFLIKK